MITNVTLPFLVCLGPQLDTSRIFHQSSFSSSDKSWEFVKCIQTSICWLWQGAPSELKQIESFHLLQENGIRDRQSLDCSKVHLLDESQKLSATFSRIIEEIKVIITGVIIVSSELPNVKKIQTNSARYLTSYCCRFSRNFLKCRLFDFEAWLMIKSF